MNIFGWKSTGRGLLRPAKARVRQDRLSGVRAYGQTGLGDWPRNYEAQIRELYLGNVIAQRAVGMVVQGLAAAPLSANDPAARALVTTSSGGQDLLETMTSHLMLHGNAFVEILSGTDGRPAELYALRPERVTIEADRHGQQRAPTGLQTRGRPGRSVDMAKTGRRCCQQHGHFGTCAGHDVRG
ncbi:MAG: hypothetical protein ACKVOS_04980 [Sphingorhabdus sp.]|uniref:hypothetical protein n=1 Tax=Sphingorhabdus sp. TaxID=1902408 RepID=UPI0038FCDD6C